MLAWSVAHMVTCSRGPLVEWSHGHVISSGIGSASIYYRKKCREKSASLTQVIDQGEKISKEIKRGIVSERERERERERDRGRGRGRERERERDDIKKKVRVFTYILARDILAER